MKKALLLLAGFVSHAWDCVEFACADLAVASGLVYEFGWKLSDAFL